MMIAASIRVIATRQGKSTLLGEERGSSEGTEAAVKEEGQQ